MSDALRALLASEHPMRRLAVIVAGTNTLTFGLAWSITSGIPTEAAEHVLIWCGIG